MEFKELVMAEPEELRLGEAVNDDDTTGAALEVMTSIVVCVDRSGAGCTSTIAYFVVVATEGLGVTVMTTVRVVFDPSMVVVVRI